MCFCVLNGIACTYLALGEHWLEVRPGLGLRGVGEQVHDDSSLVDSLVNVEEVLARDPTVLLGLLPRSTTLSDTDDDVQAVVAKVETLTVTLGAISDESEGVVLEVLEELLSWPVGSLCARVRYCMQLIVLSNLDLPKTSSLTPAKSTVLTPRVCCADTAIFGDCLTAEARPAFRAAVK